MAMKDFLYLASQVEVATVYYFLLSQDMYELPSMKLNLLVDVCLVKQPAQSESKKLCKSSVKVSPLG